MSSDWYFDEAVRILEDARGRKGNDRRRRTARAIRNLIAFMAGRTFPTPNAVNTCDDMVCDRCFCRINVRGSGKRSKDTELCNKCSREVQRIGGRGRNGVHPSPADDPTHEKRIQAHKKKVRRELLRLGMEKTDE